MARVHPVVLAAATICGFERKYIMLRERY